MILGVWKQHLDRCDHGLDTLQVDDDGALVAQDRRRVREQWAENPEITHGSPVCAITTCFSDGVLGTALGACLLSPSLELSLLHEKVGEGAGCGRVSGDD